MEPMVEQKHEQGQETSEADPALVWERLPAGKRQEALQTLVLLLVRQVEGRGDEQPSQDPA
jgi:hypothetical protein